MRVTEDAQRRLLSVDRAERGRTVLLRLAGELDFSTVGCLASAVPTGADADRVVLDCRDLRFIDSAGLAAVLSLNREFGTQLRVVRGSAQVQRTFEITGLTTVLAFYDSPELAAAG